MRRATTILLILSALLVLLAMPMSAQDGATPAPAATTGPTATSAPAATTAAGADPVSEASPAPPASSRPLPMTIPAGDGPAVQAVFYFSPSCGHCHYVITEVLPGLFLDNGGEYVITFDQSLEDEPPSFYLMSNGRLQLLMVDVTQEAGNAMYVADVEMLGFDQPPGVPLLHVGDDWYVGSGDIPDNLPGIVKTGLAGDGVAWPPAPGIDAAIAPFLLDGSVAAGDPPEDDQEGTALVLPVGGDDGPLDKFGRDPLGNSISIIVLLALLASLVAVPLLAVRGSLPLFPSWLVIVLAAVGLGVAAYLASIETSGSEAVCGPVGDCNAVQESEYAELFGIPIGVLGVMGYLLMGGLWLIARVTHGGLADGARVLMAAGAFAGTLFSAWLTFLEPFVIGATCMWCITSAIVMLSLLWVSSGRGWAAWQRLRAARGSAHSATAASS